MSENIFNNIPDAYRGSFIEDQVLPHAFSRDGDVDNNHRAFVDYIMRFVA